MKTRNPGYTFSSPLGEVADNAVTLRLSRSEVAALIAALEGDRHIYATTCAELAEGIRQAHFAGTAAEGL